MLHAMRTCNTRVVVYIWSVRARRNSIKDSLNQNARARAHPRYSPNVTLSIYYLNGIRDDSRYEREQGLSFVIKRQNDDLAIIFEITSHSLRRNRLF